MSIGIRHEDDHPSRHVLTRLHAGELEGEERDRIQSHVEDCEACQGVLRGLGEERNTFHARRDKASFLRRVEQAAARPGTSNGDAIPWWQMILRPAPIAAACAVVLAAILTFTLLPGEPTEHMKGGDIELGYYVMKASGPEVAEPGHVLHPGDRIQFRLTAPAGGYVHVVGVDEAGAVSVYFPRADAQPEEFPGGAGRPVPGSVILDETLGRERVFLLICERPHAHAALRSLLGAEPRALIGKDQLPVAEWKCRQESLLLSKE